MAQDWISFGDPRVKCPKCGLIVLFPNIKEWKLRSYFDRAWIIFKYYTFQNLAYVLGLALLLFLLLTIIPTFFGKSYNDIFTGECEIIMWISFIILSFLVIAIKRHITFMTLIRESNNRMKDSNYSHAMKELKIKR
jgi:hypothetical protein